MTIKELIQELQKYPEDTNLRNVDIQTIVLQHRPTGTIKTVYVADYRIAGGKPLGNEINSFFKCDLSDVARSLLLGLQMEKKKNKI